MNGKFSLGHILFNLAGGAIVLSVVGYGVFSFFVDEERGACSARYPAASVMALRKSNGNLFSPMQFKTSIGRAERGIIENVRLYEQPASHGSVPTFKVNLEEGTSTGYKKRDPAGGIGFAWSPNLLTTADAACLRFKMRLPNDFDYGRGGLLPGIYGGKPLRADQPGDGIRSFSTRLVWRPKGEGMAYIQVPDTKRAGRGLVGRSLKLPRGNWIDVQQEVVMNDPGKENGILRIWVDGRMKLEHTQMVWRTNKSLGASGVISEIAYGTPSRGGTAPKTTNITFSAFELSWQGGRSDQQTAASRSANTTR